MSRTLVLAVIPFLVLACGDDKEDTSLPEDTGPFETCTAASLDEGSTGTYVVNAGGDDHVKHHWYMPEGIDHIRATATWTADVAWLLEYAGGIGWCPHSGTTIGDAVEGDTGEIVLDLYPVDVDDTSTTFTFDEQWFVHIGLADYTEHANGESLDYAMDVQLCTSTAAK